MASFRMFGYNGRGLSFEVQEVCAAMHTPVKCDVRFNNMTIVTIFGSVKQGKLESNADIAGVGVRSFSFPQAKLI